MGKSFFKKMIVAVNGHRSSVHSSMYAIMMARTYNISIKFIYVVDTATVKYLSMNKFLVSDERYDYEERLKEDGERYLAYAQMLAGSKGLKCETELRSGGVFTEILRAADEYEADLIILGGNEKDENQHNLKRNVLSTDQNEVLAHSKVPVMIIQKPDIEKIFKIF
ncbi:Nucleotide-binding universal stress protein, UspA family [Treponema bryantii]|uniref:Nucleotide-binding universal stress protein, UspA family n=1 Tax=Treponema bryantii TaxID=163 RepID=A0A1H9JPH7_9SPIR|nr:universal stress protein [Treponema bryantii]BDC92899.1 universal stress protein [Treponema bryantii]SEQ88742.1 Nucleotide-binding universal stress protein, UspA family [Treponema bryantii]